jgi:uncharacterized protein (DUF2345 family)
MDFFVGVVEDRFDPLEIGRCRVRVFGVHTANKRDLPTVDLPWSIPLNGMDNAATSGVGQSPNGVVHGTWVVGFFMDGEDKQQFMMMGTLTSIQAAQLIKQTSTSPQTTTTTPTVSSTAVAAAVAVAAGDAAVTNSPPVVNTTTGTVDPTTVRQPNGWVIGQTSKQYESGSMGCGAINKYSNSGDLGGASYGTYQFASYLPAKMPTGKSRPNAAKSPLVTYLAASRFSDKFAGLSPATPAFDQAWTACASSNNADFTTDQHDFIKTKYYDVMIGNLRRNGLDLSGFGAGVQDLVWSTAVQMGPARTSVFLTPLKGMTQLDDITIINKVSDYKIQNVPTLFARSSANIQAGVATRYASEKKALLKLASGYNSAAQAPSTPAEKATVLPPKPPTPIPANPDILGAIAAVFSSNSPIATPAYVPKTDPDNQSLLVATSTGFSDPDGVYPTKDYDQQPDTNKLARGIYAGTPAEDKSLNRATGIRLPGNDAFDQPLNPYNAQYPYNKVFQSEAGHVVEYDDTPGSERINVYHTSGTFTEIDAYGNMTRRVVGSDYQITDGNGYVRIEGQCNISVGGSANIVVAADANIEVDGDTYLTVGNDIVAEAGGRISLSAAEAIDLRAPNIYIEADEELHITAGSKINAETDGPINVKSATGTYIQAGNELDITVGSDLSVHVGGDIDFETEGNANIKAAGDAKFYGEQSAHLKSAGMTALDGGTMQIQAGASIKADGASPVTPEEADYSEAGLLDGRTNYDENFIDDEFPTLRVDTVVLAVETPEEAANGGTETVRAALVADGTATASELAVTPVSTSTPESNYVLPTVAVPVAGKSSDQVTYIKSLSGIPVGYKLTPNFTLGQLSASAPAQRDKVRAQFNLTEGEIVSNLYEVAANVLEPIKAAYPNMFVTSAFRDQSHNTVKGVSQHCLGLAADMQFSGAKKTDYYDIAAAIRALLPTWDQLLLEFKTTGTGNPWIHVSFNSKGNRRQVLTMFNNAVHGNGLIQLA